MSNFSPLEISASGLFAQRARLDAIANNIANANTTRTPEGGPYKRQEVMFQERLDEMGNVAGVEVAGVKQSTAPPTMVYDPGNPDAGKDGMVAMPNVSPVQEMVDMIAATRAYEANVQAINAAHTMTASALEIGR